MSSDIYLNGITYPASRKVAFPGKDGKEVVFDLPEDADKELSPYSERPVQNRVVHAAINSEAAARSEADAEIRQMLTSPFNFKGTVASASALPSSGNAVNDTYYVEDVKYRVTWTGSAWQQSSMDESSYTDELAAVQRSLDKHQSVLTSGFATGPNLLSATPSDRTHNGVTFAWNGMECTVTGEATGSTSSFCNFWGSTTTIPGALSPGGRYRLRVYTTDSNIRLAVNIMRSGENKYQYYSGVDDAFLDLPSDLTAILFRVNVFSGDTVNGTFSMEIQRVSTLDGAAKTIQRSAVGYERVDLNLYQFRRGLLRTDGLFGSSNSPHYYHALVPVDASWREIVVQPRDHLYAVVGLLASDVLTDGLAPTWAEGVTSRHLITRTTVLSIPDDCTHIFVQLTSNDVVVTPNTLAGATGGGAVFAMLDKTSKTIDKIEAGLWASDVDMTADLETGGIGTDGGKTGNNYRARTAAPFLISAPARVTFDCPGVSVWAVYYSTPNILKGNYIGATSSVDDGNLYVYPVGEKSTWVMLVFKNTSADTTPIADEDMAAISATLRAETSSEVDKSLAESGMAADAMRVGRMLRHLGWLGDAEFVQGARQSDNRVASSASNVCFAEGLYVGKGTTLDILLDDYYGGSVSFGPTKNGPWDKVITGNINGVTQARDEYMMVNLCRYADHEGTKISLRVTNIHQHNPLSIIRKDAASGDGTQYDSDYPETQGAANFLRRIKQMIGFQSVLTADLPCVAIGSTELEYHEAGSLLTGIPYSSTWDTMHFVPQGISFHAYGTALRDPDSYLYTRMSTGRNRTYFGQVCSTFVSYVWGLDEALPTSFALPYMDGVTELASQTVDALKVGDLLREPGHVAVVGDIQRNARTGEVVRIAVAEGWYPLARQVWYAPEPFRQRFFEGGYVAYRFDGLADVTYRPSPWVPLPGEAGDPAYSVHMCPRLGDKTNWPAGEPVVVDILSNQEGYTGWKLTKDGVLADTGTISGTVISFDDLAYGKYSLCLTGGAGDSESVSWIVVDNQETFAVTDASGIFSFEAASANAVPVSVFWDNSPVVGSRSSDACGRVKYLDGSAGTAVSGTVNVDMDPMSTISAYVCYRTEYGLFFSPNYRMEFN